MAKPRHPRFPSRRFSPVTLILTILLMFTVGVLVLLAIGTISYPRNSPRANDLSSIVRKTFVRIEADERLGEKWVEQISWKPRAIVYHNFLAILSPGILSGLHNIVLRNMVTFPLQSKEECKYLIELAKPHLHKSTVVDSATGRRKDSSARTSSGASLKRGQDKIISHIEKRIADFTFIPVENGEGLQVLHYEVGQKYEPHHDYFTNEFNTKNGGQRMATVLMYLSDVEEGGETVFPAAKSNISAVSWWDQLSDCAKKGLSVRPKMGDALLFWSMNPDATLDASSLHGGCPVIKGNKWLSTKWIRVNEYAV